MGKKEQLHRVFLENLTSSARKKFGFDTEKLHGLRRKIANATGIDEGTVRKWFKKTIPNAEQLVKIYKSLGLSPNYLLGIGPILDSSLEHESTVSDRILNIQDSKGNNGGYVAVVIFEDLHLLAKNCQQIDKNAPVLRIPLRIKFFNTTVGNRYGMTLIREKTGMEPIIGHGDIIIVNFSDTEIKKEDRNENKIYLVRDDDEFLLRYVGVEKDNGARKYILTREGGKSISIPYQENTVLGRIVRVCKEL